MLLFWYLDGFERVCFNQFQVIGLSLKLNGQYLRGKTDGPVILFCPLTLKAFSPDFDFVPHTESHSMVLSFSFFCSVLCTCFLLEIHPFYICWHLLSKRWRETVCWPSFCSERGSATDGRLLLKWRIKKMVFTTSLWNGKDFVLSKNNPETPKLYS